MWFVQKKYENCNNFFLCYDQADITVTAAVLGAISWSGTKKIQMILAENYDHYVSSSV